MRKIEIEKAIDNLKTQVIDLKYRATGISTRLVDQYIQEIYGNEGEWVEINDHYPSMNANKLLAERVIARLKAEHRNDEFKFRKIRGFEIMLVRCVRDSVLDDMKRLNQEIAALKQQLKELEG